MSAPERVLVNVADWTGAPDIPEGWLIVNAPRPLNGEIAWQGPFRHGVFYVAGPADDEALRRHWKSYDAWPVVFITNAEIEVRVLAKFAEYGYASADEAGVTIAEQAECMSLPWRD